MKRVLVTLAALGACSLSYLALAGKLANSDPIGGILLGDWSATFSLVVVVGLRLLLVLCAPVWLVWLVVDAVERRFTNGERARIGGKNCPGTSTTASPSVQPPEA